MVPIRKNELPIDMSPEGGESDFINAAFDRFFETVEQKETDRGTMLFSKLGRDADPFEGDKETRAEVRRQMDEVKEVRDSEGRLLAPNGKVSNLPEHLWKAVRTPFFKRWFGDWEALANNQPVVQLFQNADPQGEIDNEQVQNTAANIVSGLLTISRLTRDGERGRIKGGELLVGSSLIAGANARTDSTRGDFAQKERDENALEAYARSVGQWFTYEDVWQMPRIGRGNESVVFADPNDPTSVIKLSPISTIIGESDSVLQFLDNKLAVHNTLPFTAPYELIGFTRDENQETSDLVFYAVLRQPYIKGVEGGILDFPDFDRQLRNAGFSRKTNGYEKDSVEILDIDTHNVIKATDGQFYIIDPIVVDHDFTEFKVTSNRVVNENEVSQVRDENGEPKIMYHGTNMDFTGFNPDLVGLNFDDASAGFYFTDSPELAATYANDTLDDTAYPRSGANVMPVFLNVRKPMLIQDTEPGRSSESYVDRNGELIAGRDSGGIDGAIVRTEGGRYSSTVAVAFDPAQVKSIFNRGTYDESGRMLFKKRTKEAAELLRSLATAHTQDILEGTRSNFEGDDLYLNEYASEEVRRLLATEAYNFSGEESEIDAFGGVVIDAPHLRTL